MSSEIHVAFVGNPNCGKTTLFNDYTGAKLKVANWPGVTVEKKEGAYRFKGEAMRLVDLPGIYSRLLIPWRRRYPEAIFWETRWMWWWMWLTHPPWSGIFI